MEPARQEDSNYTRQLDKLLDTPQKHLDFLTDLLSIRLECYDNMSCPVEKTLFNEKTEKLKEIYNKTSFGTLLYSTRLNATEVASLYH